jgi:hypothetical protein
MLCPAQMLGALLLMRLTLRNRRLQDDGSNFASDARFRRCIFMGAMSRNRFPLALVLVPSFILISAAASTVNRPIWSKKGVSFPAYCTNDEIRRCKPLRIPSPNGASAIEITYSTGPDDPDDASASLRVVTNGNLVGEVGPVATGDVEIVRSPDSKAFFIDGSFNANGWDTFAVHRLDDPDLGPGNISEDVGEDMVRSFPPCRAKDPFPGCAELAEEPDKYIGAVAIDWLGDSSHIIVMGEVPCSSSMGGIMCQVLGYELEVPSGEILRRMAPKEFAREWRHSIAWKFQDPGPPDFAAGK